MPEVTRKAGGQEGAKERKREERSAGVRHREGGVDRALLQLVGSSVELALGWHPLPGRRSGPLGVGQRHPLTGRVALLGWTCPLWPCWAEEAAGTWHNTAQPALPGPGGESPLGRGQQTQRLWLGREPQDQLHGYWEPRGCAETSGFLFRLNEKGWCQRIRGGGQGQRQAGLPGAEPAEGVASVGTR